MKTVDIEVHRILRNLKDRNYDPPRLSREEDKFVREYIKRSGPTFWEWAFEIIPAMLWDDIRGIDRRKHNER